MRIDSNQKTFIYNYWHNQNADNQVYLFGSRADNDKKGGDLDILIVSEKKINHVVLYKMKMEFCLKFGNQKIDVVNLTNDENSAFKDHLLSYAKKIINE